MSKRLHQQIAKLALDASPEEVCGVVKEGKAIRCENKASEPTQAFLIDAATYLKYVPDTIFHSHPVGLYGFSEHDIAVAANMDLTSYVYVVETDTLEKWSAEKGIGIQEGLKPMMKITLEGVAGKRFGREHTLAVRNPNEALRALCQLIPGFREFLTCAHEYGIFFQVITNNQDKVDYEGLGLSCTSFSLVPVITGALNFSFRNLGLILVGALLVAVSMGAFGIAYGAVGTISYGLKMAAFSLGMGLIFTGIAGIFAPGVPQDGKQEGREADDAVFAEARARQAREHPSPLLYGSFLFKTCQLSPLTSMKRRDTCYTSSRKGR